jgi:hypothetical protein
LQGVYVVWRLPGVFLFQFCDCRYKWQSSTRGKSQIWLQQVDNCRHKIPPFVRRDIHG